MRSAVASSTFATMSNRSELSQAGPPMICALGIPYASYCMSVFTLTFVAVNRPLSDPEIDRAAPELLTLIDATSNAGSAAGASGEFGAAALAWQVAFGAVTAASPPAQSHSTP